jgi:holo-[acyl-carrier protein] synthase
MSGFGTAGGAIVGLGIDVVELERIAEAVRRHGDRFVARYCTDAERRGGERLARLGGLFAAKEAVLKALGTGWAAGLGFRQIEVLADPLGAPRVTLHGAALERATAIGALAVHLSITHERRYAAAVAILEGSRVA